VATVLQLRVETILDRQEDPVARKTGENGGVVVALRAEQNDIVGGLPIREVLKVGAARRQAIDDDAMLPAPEHLLLVASTKVTRTPAAQKA